MTYIPKPVATAAAALSGADGIAVNQGGVAKQTTLAALKTFVTGAGTATGSTGSTAGPIGTTTTTGSTAPVSAASSFVTNARSANTAAWGTAVVASAAQRAPAIAGESASGGAVTTAGPSLTIFDGSIWTLGTSASNGLQVYKGGALLVDGSGNATTFFVSTLVYFDGKIYIGTYSDKVWYTNYGNGSTFYIIGGDPRTCWAVGDPRAPNQAIPYGLGIKAQNPGGDANNLAAWEANLNRFTQAIGKPSYCGVFINFGDDPSLWATDAAGTAADWAKTPSSANIIPVSGFPMASNSRYYGTSGTYGGVAYAHANNYDFDQFISGAYDTMIQGVANGWFAHYDLVYFRPGYEMNGGFMPWYMGDETVTQGKWVTAFQRIHTQLHLAATNYAATWSAANGGAAYTGNAKVVKVVWNPASINFTNLDTFAAWPGDAYVDLIGIDTYSPIYPQDLWNWNSTGGGLLASQEAFSADQTNRQHFWDYPGGKQYAFDGGTYFSGWQSIVNFAKAHGKHLCVPECGAGQGANYGNNPPTFDQGPVDEWAFPTWLRSRCDQAVAMGVPMDFLIIWPTRQSDGQWGCLDPYEKPYQILAWSAAFGGGGTAVANYFPPAPVPAPTSTSTGAPSVFNSGNPPAPSGGGTSATPATGAPPATGSTPSPTPTPSPSGTTGSTGATPASTPAVAVVKDTAGVTSTLTLNGYQNFYAGNTGLTTNIYYYADNTNNNLPTLGFQDGAVIVAVTVTRNSDTTLVVAWTGGTPVFN